MRLWPAFVPLKYTRRKVLFKVFMAPEGWAFHAATDLRIFQD